VVKDAGSKGIGGVKSTELEHKTEFDRCMVLRVDIWGNEIDNDKGYDSGEGGVLASRKEMDVFLSFSL